MFFIFQPLYLEQWGASPVLIGTLLGANGIAMALAMLPAGYLSDRLGPQPIIRLSWVVGMIAAWGMALANTMPLFVIAMVLYYSSSFAMPPMNSYIVRVRGTLSLERALTLTSVMYNAGAILGPSIGGWIGTMKDLKTIYTFSSIIMLISVLVIFMVKKIDIEKDSPELLHQPKSRRFHSRFWVFVGLSTLIIFVLYMPQPLSSNFLQNFRGLDISTIGKLGTIGNLGNTVILLALGNLPAYYGILSSQFLVALFSLLIWKGTGTIWYGLGYFLYGGFRLGRSMLIAFTRQLVDPKKLGLAYGFFESANSISIILAPLLAGYLYSYKPELVYTVNIALILAVFSFTAVYLLKIQKASQVDSTIAR